MILLIDNYDSFVHNLARYVADLGGEPLVVRNDALSATDIHQLAPSHIILSPGPCTPSEAGVSTTVVRRLGSHVPVLGVCLGHQCVGAAYGARIIRAKHPMHGKRSLIRHDGDRLFSGLPSPFEAGRYHSLVVDPESVPGELEVVATSDDGEIMALRHRRHPVWGLQFHPESVLTSYGYHLLHRFLSPTAPAPPAMPEHADWPRFDATSGVAPV